MTVYMLRIKAEPRRVAGIECSNECGTLATSSYTGPSLRIECGVVCECASCEARAIRRSG